MIVSVGRANAEIITPSGVATPTWCQFNHIAFVIKIIKQESVRLKPINTLPIFSRRRPTHSPFHLTYSRVLRSLSLFPRSRGRYILLRRRRGLYHETMSDREGGIGSVPEDDLSLPKATVAKMITGAPVTFIAGRALSHGFVCPIYALLSGCRLSSMLSHCTELLPNDMSCTKETRDLVIECCVGDELSSRSFPPPFSTFFLFLSPLPMGPCCSTAPARQRD